MKAGVILNQAVELIEGERNVEHGDRHENFGRIAGMWSAYLGVEITPDDVGYMLSQLKMARHRSGKPTEDNAIDAAAYCGLAGELYAKRLLEQKWDED